MEEDGGEEMGGMGSKNDLGNSCLTKQPSATSPHPPAAQTISKK